MTRIYRINSVITFFLAASFYYFFMFTKHDASLSAIIPFANDPYDAIGSFAVIISVLLGILALIRAFRPYRNRPPTVGQSIILVRTQVAIVVAVLVTIAADLVVMMRHPSEWMGQPGEKELLILLVVMGTFAAVIGFWARHTVSGNLSAIKSGLRRPISVSLIFAIGLVLYPEGIIQSTFGEIISLIIGIFLILVPMSAITSALVLYEANGIVSAKAPIWFSSRWVPWCGVAFLGAGLGTFLLIAESRGGISHSRLAVVLSVFVGAGTFGLLTAYAFLREPLGLFQL
jgi:hypothetical protein